MYLFIDSLGVFLILFQCPSPLLPLQNMEFLFPDYVSLYAFHNKNGLLVFSKGLPLAY